MCSKVTRQVPLVIISVSFSFLFFVITYHIARRQWHSKNLMLFYWNLDEILLNMCFSVFSLNFIRMYLMSFENVQSFIVINRVKSNQGAFPDVVYSPWTQRFKECMSRDIQSISLVLLLLLVIKAVTDVHSLRLLCFSKITKITIHLLLGLPSAFAV